MGDPRFRCAFVHLAMCLWEKNAPSLSLILIFCSLRVRTRWSLQSLQTLKFYDNCKNFKGATFFSPFPILSPTILYTHPHALSKWCIKNLFMLSSLEKEVWQRVETWETLSLLIHSKLHTSPITYYLIFVFVRKNYPPLCKRELPLSSTIHSF